MIRTDSGYAILEGDQIMASLPEERGEAIFKEFEAYGFAEFRSLFLRGVVAGLGADHAPQIDGSAHKVFEIEIGENLNDVIDRLSQIDANEEFPLSVMINSNLIPLNSHIELRCFQLGLIEMWAILSDKQEPVEKALAEVLAFICDINGVDKPVVEWHQRFAPHILRAAKKHGRDHLLSDHPAYKQVS
jgi:hypothetical protein